MQLQPPGSRRAVLLAIGALACVVGCSAGGGEGSGAAGAGTGAGGAGGLPGAAGASAGHPGGAGTTGTAGAGVAGSSAAGMGGTFAGPAGAAGNAPGRGGAAGTSVAGTGGAVGGRGGGAAGSPAGGAPGAGGTGPHVCGSGAENDDVTLTCPSGQSIDSVVFASYGTPTGACGAFAAGSCNATTSVDVVKALCLGRQSCTIPASNASFGDPCNKTVKKFAVEVACAVGGGAGGAGGSGGTQVPFKGVANSPCDARKALNVSWYYNWEQAEKEPCSDGKGGVFVPMIWGHTGNEQSATGITNAVASFVSKKYDYVLGFNEPDNPDQSNIPVATAISLWPSFDNKAIKIVSPGTAANANPGQAWFTSFMNMLNADPSLRADALAIHWYGWNSGSCDANASQLESYIKWAEGFSGNRPIWITEWGCLNQSAPDVQTVVKFYNAALAVFARHPRIQRYAWYPWSTNLTLVNDDGSLTALGMAYAAAPAYK
jgi:hypothetical protein